MPISKELEASGVLDKMILAMDAFNKAAVGSLSKSKATETEAEGSTIFDIKKFEKAYAEVNTAKEELANRLQYMLLINRNSNTLKEFRQNYKEIRNMAEQLIKDGKPGLVQIIIDGLKITEIQRLVKDSDLDQSNDSLFKKTYWDTLDTSQDKVPLNNTTLSALYGKLKEHTQGCNASTLQLKAIEIFREELESGKTPNLITKIESNSQLKDTSPEEVKNIIKEYESVCALLINDERVQNITDGTKISKLEAIIKEKVASEKMKIPIIKYHIEKQTSELKQVSQDAVPNIGNNASLKSKPKKDQLSFLSHNLLNYEKGGRMAEVVSKWEKQNPLDLDVLLVKLNNYLVTHNDNPKFYIGVSKAAQGNVAKKLITALETRDPSIINQAVADAKKEISTKGLTVFYKKTNLEKLISEIEKAQSALEPLETTKAEKIQDLRAALQEQRVLKSNDDENEKPNKGL